MLNEILMGMWKMAWFWGIILGGMIGGLIYEKKHN